MGETLTDGFPFGLLKLDASGTVIHYSPAAEQNSEVPADNIVGRNFFNDIMPCPQVRQFKSRFLAFMAYGDLVQRFTISFPFEQSGIKAQIVLARITQQAQLGSERLALVRLMPDTPHNHATS